MTEAKRQIGEYSLKSVPRSRIRFLLKDKSVTPEKLSPRVAEEVVAPMIEEAVKGVEAGMLDVTVNNNTLIFKKENNI